MRATGIRGARASEGIEPARRRRRLCTACACASAESFAEIELDDDGGLDAGGRSRLPGARPADRRRGLTGMEWAVGVPGSVGGAVRMNAGGHGAETSDRLVSCRVIDLAGGGERLVEASALELSYRHSALGPNEVVTEALFQLEHGETAAQMPGLPRSSVGAESTSREARMPVRCSPIPKATPPGVLSRRPV